MKTHSKNQFLPAMKSNPHHRLRSARAGVLTTLILLSCGPAFGATFTWDPANTANGTTIDADSGTWNTITTDTGGTNIVWNDAGTNKIWAQDSTILPLHNAVFAGADGTYAITVGESLAAQNLAFSNSGYTLSAAAPVSIRVTSPTGISVASGKSATIGTNVTVQKNSAGFIIGGGGTLNISGTGAAVRTSSGNLPIRVSANTTVNVGTGGLLLAGAGMNTETGTTAVNVTGGSVTLGGNAATNLLALANDAAAVSSVFTLTGGTVTNNAISGGLRFGLATANSASSTFHLDGGILTVASVFEGETSHTSAFNFNGGTIKTRTNSTLGATFMAGIDTVNVRDGGAKFDTNGVNTTVGQALAHSIIGGDTAIDGGLTKQGLGTLELTGASTYTGNTTIQAGTLKLGTGGSIASSQLVDVQSGAFFDVTTSGFGLGAAKTLKGGGSVSGTVTVADTGIVTGGNGTTGTLTIDALTFSNGGVINVGSLGNYTGAPAVNVIGALTLGGGAGAVTINLPTATTTSGIFKLLGFGSGISDANGFILGTGPTLGPRQSGGLQYDGTNKLITYTITSENPIWTGAQSSEWSTNVIGGSKNWKLPDNSPTDFLTGDEVVFNDTATNKTVSISGGADVNPSIVTFDNSTGNDYTLQGANGIAGAAVLTKNGTGALTITNTNSYSGATTITEGTLQIGAGGTTGTLGSGAVTNNGALVFNRSNDLAFSNLISGTGSLTKNGAGTLTSSAENSFTGPLTINGGTLVFSNDGSSQTVVFGSTLVNINNGSTLSVTGTQNLKIFENKAYTFGSSGGGAILLGPGNYDAGVANVPFSITTTGGARNNISGGGPANGFNLGGSVVTFDVALGSDATSDLTIASVIANNGSVVKTGSGRLTFEDTFISPNFYGNIYNGTTTVSNGTLFVNGNQTNANGAVSVAGGATLGGTGIVGGAVTAAAGSTIAPGTSIGTLTVDDNVTLGGTYACEVNGTGKDVLAVVGNLDVTGATLAVSPIGAGANQSSYVIATYTGALSGTFIVSPALPVGYTVDYATAGQIKLVSASSPYDTWATLKGLTGLPGSATDPAKGADPDNDGRNNIGEFAFNGNPLSGSDNGKVYLLTEDSLLDGDALKELILTVAVRAGTLAFAGSPSPSANQAADGITYSIEGSLDLAGFPTTVNVVSPAIITGLPIDPGMGYEYRSFSLSGSNGLTGKGFLRAKVTSP